MKKKHLIILLLIWTSILFFSFTWNFNLIKKNNRDMALNKSQAFFEQIILTREWNLLQGGVYVPITKETQPNTQLKNTSKDVTTLEGLKLTKINPAYMTRQISEINKKKSKTKIHITSLNPIHPENKADSWETNALLLFEKGEEEKFELVNHDTILTYRYMAPLFTERSCINCHDKQGYKLGDIRGGISVSFDAESYVQRQKKQFSSLGIVHILIFVIGIYGILYFQKISNKYYLSLNNKNNELLRSNETKNKLFSIISHDLKSPFNGILGVSGLVLENIRQKDYAKAEKFSFNVYKTSRQVYTLLDNLLNWARIQDNRIKFNPNNINLEEMVHNISCLLEINLVEKNLTFITNIQHNLMVFADDDILETVIRNLISNAIKYTNKGDNITFTARKNGDEVKISIADTGIGISNEDIIKIFDPNITHSTPGTNKESGTGLGLSLCKEFIEMHGGKIWIKSEKGIGSKISFTLPDMQNQ